MRKWLLILAGVVLAAAAAVLVVGEHRAYRQKLAPGGRIDIISPEPGIVERLLDRLGW